MDALRCGALVVGDMMRVMCIIPGIAVCVYVGVRFKKDPGRRDGYMMASGGDGHRTLALRLLLCCRFC